MSRENIEVSTTFFRTAILSLRQKLTLFEGKKVSQDEMARRIGCPVRSYVRWEMGEVIPSGDWLIKMMRLCPDAPSLAAFGLDISQFMEQYPKSHVTKKQPVSDLADRSPVPRTLPDGRTETKMLFPKRGK